MKRLGLILLLSLAFASAQETCESLISSISNAFEQATEVIMTTNIMQGKREFAYSKLRLYKDDAAQWQSEQLEQRGMQRPEDSQGTEDGAEPTFDFSCEGHELIQQESGWTLKLLESNPDIPVDAWMVDFGLEGETIVPVSISGAFEAKILLIPFKGSFNTAFSAWSLPSPAPRHDHNR